MGPTTASPIASAVPTADQDAAAAEPVGGDANPTFLRALAETRGFLLGRPTKITPTEDGTAILFLRTAARDPNLALFETSVATGATRQLVTPAELLQGSPETLSVAEAARRERQRIVDRGFTTFDLSKDGRRVLLPLSGRIYVYERGETNAGDAGGAKPGRIRAFGKS
ncbi:MAG TPA: S9 family peptidase, partial [Polyangia bacterium]